MYVEMKDINKNFGNYKAADNVSFHIEKGKLVGLLGPSGSGKTTLLRMIAGLETPDSGDIYIDSIRVNDMPPNQRGVGFVFQNYALFRYMSVYDNIAFGLEIQKKSRGEIKARVQELLTLIGLEGLEKRYPHQLSGGQRQRVAFARALAPNPQLLLLDEPFAAIDTKVRHELRSWLREMIDKVGVTSIFVTHDQDEAIEVADEIIVTNLGRIEQKGSPVNIYKEPLTPFVAQFIGDSTVFENYEKLKGFHKVPGATKAIVRPEYVHIEKRGASQKHMSVVEEGIVESILFRGSYLEISIDVKGISFTVNRSLDELSVEIGEKVDVLIFRIYVFDNRQTHLLENRGMVDENYVFI